MKTKHQSSVRKQTLASIGEASYDDLFWRSDVYVLTPNALLFSTGYPKRKL